MISYRTVGLLAFTLTCAFSAASQTASGGASVSASPVSVAAIVQKLAAGNEKRYVDLRSYSVLRHYEVHYRGLPSSKDAEMDVEVRYVAPATKEFRIVSESGSKFILNKVLHRLLSSEQEALSQENREETAMTVRNYDFTFVREENTPQGRFYVLQTEPKRKNKFLFRGTIWVDARDFAIARIEAEPAKNPSLWISKTEIEHRYTKFGEFWLPVQNTSVTHVRLGGTATLNITYREYRIGDPTVVGSQPVLASGADKTATLQTASSPQR